MGPENDGQTWGLQGKGLIVRHGIKPKCEGSEVALLSGEVLDQSRGKRTAP